MSRRKPQGEWVALETFARWEGTPEDMLYEAGGIYDRKPLCKWDRPYRKLEPSEQEAICSRCGMRFVACKDGGSAEANRDFHFYGDADCPSICATEPSEEPAQPILAELATADAVRRFHIPTKLKPRT
jgi:hypothetical protein